jgi:predicted transcriptional regulator
MPNIKTLRSKRLSEEISAHLLARKAGVERARLSFIECGHVQATEDELRRLSAALDDLIAAKHKVQQVAKEVGWPVGA